MSEEISGPVVRTEDPRRTFVRAKNGVEQECRLWVLQDHPLIGQECFCCRERFVEGDEITLVALGPGGDEEARRKCGSGAWYNAVAIRLHAACVFGDVHVG